MPYTYFKKWLPASGDVVGEGGSRSDLSSKSEVADFDDIVVDKQIFRLHISVEKPIFMHTSKSTCNLKHYIPGLEECYLISFSVNFLPSSFILEYTS